jgi:transketolase
MIYQAGDGHPAPALSATDLVTALYFHIMNIDPARPDLEDRDRMILSKGHACPALYAALARKGYFPPEVFPTLRHLNSILQGHPDMNKTPGIDSTAGSLGNGISIGLGMALAGRLHGKEYFTYVITGDGELNEGVAWEGLMAAAHHKAGRLIVMVDNNGYQSGGKVPDVSGIMPIVPKIEPFGWHCQDIDGHDMRAIVQAINAARAVTDAPSLIVARTTKGKGVPFMEGNNIWHKGAPTKEQFEEAMIALGGEAA